MTRRRDFINTPHQGGTKLFLSSLPVILRSYACCGWFFEFLTPNVNTTIVLLSSVPLRGRGP
jgi:hypothetical protein